MMEPMRTRRLLIRRFAPTDLDDFLAYQGDPQVRKYLRGAPMDADQAAHYLTVQAALDERAVDAWHGYAVQHVGSGAVIGDIGVYLASAVEGDVGFEFHPGFHRQGYGHEAMTAFLSYVFDSLRLDRVTAGCDQANSASRALLGRLGMNLRTPITEDASCRYELTRDRWFARA
jgi:ribosomal-protein-alanine N-acetyltransferase